MLLRSTFGILAFAALFVSASASVVTYRATGTFDQATGDFEPLIGQEFWYEFSYDTDAPNLGDKDAAGYGLLSTHLHTTEGDLDGLGAAVVDLDPNLGSINFGAIADDPFANQYFYGLNFGDLEPQTGDLPSDLVALAADHNATFFLTGLGAPRLLGVGTASTDLVRIQRVQSVPEPATMTALSAGALALARRRRSSKTA